MNRIKELRSKTGLSQSAFCEKLKMPKRTLESWEEEKRHPPEWLVDLIEFRITHDPDFEN